MAWVFVKRRFSKAMAKVTGFAKTNATDGDTYLDLIIVPAGYIPHELKPGRFPIQHPSPDEANGVPETNATEVSGASQTNVSEAVESPELFLKLATECVDRVRGVMSTSHSLKFNHNQSEYLAGNLEMAVGSADSFLRSMNSTSAGSTEFETMEPCLEIFKLLFDLSSKVEASTGSCCKEAWIKSAILLETNMMEHISSIGFMLEFCRMIFSDEITARSRLSEDHTCMTNVALSKLSNAEAQVVEEEARLDHARLYEDLSGLIRSSESSSEERQLATFLLGRLSMDGGLHPGSDVPGNQRSRLKILKESLSVLPQKLGKGAAGIVHKATWLGAEVAVKTFHGPSSDPQSDFMREVSILDGLCHPNIGALLWHTVNEQEGRIILELMDDDLYSFMRNRSPGSAPFTISEAVDIMLQVAEGMLFLHEKHIVHRDLKSGNVLVKCVKTTSARFDHLHVKVADFGLSKTKEKSMTYSNQTPNMGTTRWMAPELIKIMSNDGGDWKAKAVMKLKYPLKSDVYSFGMVCYEILTGNMPFSEITLSQAKTRILNGDDPELPNQCPHTLKRLIEDCWSFEASCRPTFGEICAQLRHIKCGTFMPLCCTSSEMEVQIKCEVCNNFCPKNAVGHVEFRTVPFWNMKYCPYHERDGTPRCCSCDRLENKIVGVYTALEDGRSVCPMCLESSIIDTRHCQPLLREILKFYEHLGMPIEQEIPVLLVVRNALNAEGSHAPEVRGICLSEERTEPSLPSRFDYVKSRQFGHLRDQKLTRHCTITAILALYGLPRLLTGSILVCQFMHAWLRLQGIFLHPKEEIGIRDVMSEIWLQSELRELNGKRSTSSPNDRAISVEACLGEFYVHKIFTGASPIAGDWYRHAMASVRKFGLPHVIEHLRRTGNFPW